MKRTISIGRQEFDKMRDRNNFYVDKTKFLEEWWNDDTDVTLITRPRRFGKTLMMSTVNCFFSIQYKDRRDLFDGLYISTCDSMMEHQGKYPVIALSFSDCKNQKDSTGKYTEYQMMVRKLKERISKVFNRFSPSFEDGAGRLNKGELKKIPDHP